MSNLNLTEISATITSFTGAGKGKTMWYLWLDSLAGFYKHGDHFVNAVYDSDGNFIREKTYEESVDEVTAYLQSSSYLGRGAKARIKGQNIIRILDVTEYAKCKDRYGPNKQVDRLIESQTILRHHMLDDKDTINPQSISEEEILRVVNAEVFGTRNIGVYSAYDKQLEAVYKADSYYKADGTDFLLDCVMRFGKCFTSYLIAKAQGAKRILIITGRPKVKNGWKDDIDHIEFAGWEFKDSQQVKSIKFSDSSDLFEATAEVEVIFASFQGSDRENYVGRLAQVVKQNIDLVIIDEFHAYLSNDAREFITKLKAKKRLWVSGTPFVAYESGMFLGGDDTYRFTLMDLQRERKAGHPRFRDFPEIQFWVAKYPDWSKSANAQKFHNEQGLNMALLLSNNDGVTNYPTEVRWLLDSIQGNMNRKDSVVGLGPRETKSNTKPVAPNHIWFSVPAGTDDTKQHGVAAAITLENEIPKHPDLKRYVPMVVRGDKTEDDVIKHMTQNSLGSSVASCRSLNTGTKFPELDTVVFMRETISATEFWQTVGRPLNPKAGKLVINIIVYSAELMVNMADAMVDIRSDDLGHQEALEEFYSLMPTHILGDATIQRLDANLAYNMLDVTGSPEKCFKNRAMFVPDIRELIADNLDFASLFPDLEKEDGNNPVVLHKSAPKGKNVGRTSVNKRTKQEENDIDKCFDRIREFMRLTVSVQASCALYEGYQVQTLNDLKHAPTQPIDSVFGPGTKKLIDELLKRGWINENVYDKTISKSYAVQIKGKV